MIRNDMPYFLDQVLMPPRGSISDLLRNDLGTATFYKALQQVEDSVEDLSTNQQANLVEELDGDGQFTVFAPTEKVATPSCCMTLSRRPWRLWTL